MRRFRWLLGPAAMLLLLSRPQAAVDGAQRAMRQWAWTVAPSLFPFLALLPFLTCADAARACEALLGRVTRAALRLPGAAAPALVVGMLAGSPAGTAAARRAAAQSGMTRGQLQRLVCAASGFSPAFVLTGVGLGMLGSAGDGMILLRAQLATQLTLALLLRRAWDRRREPVPPPSDAADDAPVRAAALSVLTVCGYMVFFSALAAALREWLGRTAGDGLLCLIDAPSGAGLLSALPLPRPTRLVALAALLGFGGLCAQAQNLSVLRGCGVPTWEYCAVRCAAAAICAGWTALQCRVRLPEGKIIGLPPLQIAALCAVIAALPAIFTIIHNPFNNEKSAE